MVRALALLLTIFTGFSGLAYEVAWEKYLATLLGSHSEATAAVLGLFLGGLSLGYALFGRVTRRIVARAAAAGRPPRLLLAYGLVEVGIGVYVIAFPWLFRVVQALSFWLPHGGEATAFGVDVVLCALLIGPPTVLMGGTIPILTQALARSMDDATRFHAWVYGFNTAGAFAGALAAGFYLIPTLGLSGVMLAMGAINLSAGAIFLLLGLRGRVAVALGSAGAERRPPGFAIYAAVALLTGFAMMALQTILIRLGGLSFGASPFTFSMVVAVFVFGIALGSLAVSVLPRIPPALVMVNQCVLATLVAALYVWLPQAPYWTHVLRSLFRDTDDAFYAYYAAGFLGILVIAGPPIILSGASLPLLFHNLRRQMGELGSVAGSLYSWNTVGSLLGALIGGYALLYWLDLHQVYAIAFGALALSAGLLWRLLPSDARRARAALVAPALASLLLLLPWEPELLSAGLFRTRERQPITRDGIAHFLSESRESYRTIFYTDDPTASVAVLEVPEGPDGLIRSILVNGKSDGATGVDYPTMALAGLVPALFAEEARRAFVIGYGTGVTAGELAELSEIEEVVVAEISPGVVEAAPLFGFANFEAHLHPKVRITRRDAYRALLRSTGQFDVIVSEPSNPWVAGVEMLFSREFLLAARARLTPDGVYAQWFHQYETDSDVVRMVLRTYTSVFDHVAVWFTIDTDLLLLGFNDGNAAANLARLARRASLPDFGAGLRRSGIGSLPALLAHEMLPVGVVNALRLDGPVHTLFQPRLSYEAGRAFFRGGAAALPSTAVGAPARVGRQNSLLGRYARQAPSGLPDAELAQMLGQVCRYRPRMCATVLAELWRRGGSRPQIARFSAIAGRVGRGEAITPDTLELLARLLPGPPLDPGLAVRPAIARRATELYRTHYLHGLPFDPERLLDQWRNCRAREMKRCEAGLAAARRMLHGGVPAAHPASD